MLVPPIKKCGQLHFKYPIYFKVIEEQIENISLGRLGKVQKEANELENIFSIHQIIFLALVGTNQLYKTILKLMWAVKLFVLVCFKRMLTHKKFNPILSFHPEGHFLIQCKELLEMVVFIQYSIIIQSSEKGLNCMLTI